VARDVSSSCGSGMTFLELCAQDHGGTRGTLSCGSGWRVCQCECVGCGQYGWVEMDCPPQWSLTSLVVLGRYGLCSYLGTPPSVTVYDP